MLTRLLELASLPLRLLECVADGASKGFVLGGGACCDGGTGRIGRLVSGALEGVAPEGMAWRGVGRSRRWALPTRAGEEVKRGGGVGEDWTLSSD